MNEMGMSEEKRKTSQSRLQDVMKGSRQTGGAKRAVSSLYKGQLQETREDAVSSHRSVRHEETISLSSELIRGRVLLLTAVWLLLVTGAVREESSCQSSQRNMSRMLIVTS